MGWSIGYDTCWERDIGYGVPAYCDHPGCGAVIDRGLGHVCCGAEPYGGEHGCGLYFCQAHLIFWPRHGGPARCRRCVNDAAPFEPTGDHPDWVAHKLTDPSWAEWRERRAVVQPT